MSENRRKHPRTVIEKPTLVETGKETFGAILHDISASGAGVSFSLARPNAPLEIGDAVVLNPDDAKRRPGRVVRHYEGGFGVALSDDRSDEDGT
ncbi:MAG: PilZ domain-containing protein [Rhodospirillales bacterium]